MFYNCREFSSSATGTNRPYFLQNKANFRKARMNVNCYLQKDCENEPRLCRLGKQSQTKPIFRRQKFTRLWWDRSLPAISVAGRKTDDRGQKAGLNKLINRTCGSPRDSLRRAKGRFGKGAP